MRRMFSDTDVELLLDSGKWRLLWTDDTSCAARVMRGSAVEWYRHHHHSVHNNRELVFCLKGRGWYGFSDSVYSMVPGTVLFFDCFEKHQNGYASFYPDSEHLWVSVFADHFAARLLSVRKGRMRSVPGGSVLCEADALGMSLNNRAFAFLKDASIPVCLRRARLTSILLWVLACAVERSMFPAPDGGHGDYKSRVIEAITRHIRETAGRGASLESLAQLSGYSKYHFLRVFKEKTGQTVLAYIDMCREIRTREMLAEGARKKEIADVLGFSCQAAFSRWLASRL